MVNDFLFGDYRYLNERVRMLVYGLLLLLGYDVFFHTILDRLEYTPNELFWPSGIFRIWSSVFDREDYVAFIRHTRHVFVFLWLFAALGFLGRLPMVATAFFAFVYWGIFKSDSGSIHRFHVPMYALVTMGLVCKPGRHSLDAYLYRILPRYPFRPSPPSVLEGFALKCLLTLTAYVFLSAGISKIWNGGLDWMDGETLYQYLVRYYRPSGPFGEKLLQFLLQHKLLIRLLSIWTVVFELSFIIAVFVPRSRLFLFLNACIFHIGIYLVLAPKYLPQMVVYLLLVNWDRVVIPDSWSFFGWCRHLFGLEQAPKTPWISGRTLWFSAGFYMLLLSLLAATIVIQREHYPLTHVPMYSNSMKADRIGGHTHEELRDINVLKKLSREYLDRGQPYFLTFHLPSQLIIEKNVNGRWEPVRFQSGMKGKGGGVDNPASNSGDRVSSGLLESKANRFMHGEIAGDLWAQRITVSLMRDLESQPLSDDMLFPNADRIFKAVCMDNSLRTGFHDGYRLVWRLKDGTRIISVCDGVNINVKGVQ